MFYACHHTAKWSQNENFFISERFSLKFRMYNHFLNLFRVMYYRISTARVASYDWWHVRLAPLEIPNLC